MASNADRNRVRLKQLTRTELGFHSAVCINSAINSRTPRVGFRGVSPTGWNVAGG